MGKRKRIIALLSAGLIGFGAAVTGSVAVTGSFDTSCVYAAGIIVSGTYEGMSWRITEDDVLELGEEGTVQSLNGGGGYDTFPWFNLGSLGSTYNNANLKEVRCVGNIVASGDISNMFYSFNMRNIKKIDLSGFDTSNVTSMSGMFSYCENLTELNISGFNTSNVTNMSNMFTDCRSLTDLDLSHFNTSKVTGMDYMFSSCWSLKNLNLNGWDTSKVYLMRGLFDGCSALESIGIDITDIKTDSLLNPLPSEQITPGCENIISGSSLIDIYKDEINSYCYTSEAESVKEEAIELLETKMESFQLTNYAWECHPTVSELRTLQNDIIYLRNNRQDCSGGGFVSPTLYKRLLQNNTTLTPDMTFSFSFEQQSQWEGVQYVSTATPIGDKSVTITQNSERLTQDEYVGNLTGKKLYQEKVDNVLSDFNPTTAGTYCYLVKENVPSPGLADVTYTGSQFIMKVEVDSNLEVTNVTNILYKDSSGKTKDQYSTPPEIFSRKNELIFYNTYGTTGGTTPTGIITNIAPFIIIGGAGITGLVLYVVINARRKAKQNVG